MKSRPENKIPDLREIKTAREIFNEKMRRDGEDIDAPALNNRQRRQDEQWKGRGKTRF